MNDEDARLCIRQCAVFHYARGHGHDAEGMCCRLGLKGLRAGPQTSQLGLEECLNQSANCMDAATYNNQPSNQGCSTWQLPVQYDHIPSMFLLCFTPACHWVRILPGFAGHTDILPLILSPADFGSQGQAGPTSVARQRDAASLTGLKEPDTRTC